MSLHTPALTPPIANPNASALARRQTENFVTALSAPLAQHSQIAQLVSVTGLSTDTAVDIIVDPGTDKQEAMIGWVDSLNIINMARGDEGTDVDHAQGAVVVCYQTAMSHNSLVDFMLEDHNPDGTHHPTFLVGETRVWPVSAMPDANWLPCDGRSLLRATYPDLFTLLGTLYGNVDGTHFNVPNYKGRALVGPDAGQTEFATVGQTGGEKTHILLTAELPSHTHTINDPGHAHSAFQNAHSHGLDPGGGFGAGGANAGRFRADANSPATTWGNGHTDTQQPGVGVNAAATGITAAQTGSGTAHNILQPYAVANYIIRALP